MNRRKLLLPALAASIAVLAVASWAAASSPAWNHDPASASGPAHWGTVDPGFEQCQLGTSQSPVNIGGAVKGEGPSLQFRYPDNELVVENTGHTIEVPIPADNGNTLTIGKSVYKLVQYHFHAPSEHTLNGKHYDLEVHLVHQNAAGQTAVVAIFMNIGNHANELVNDIFHNAPDVAGTETDTGIESNATGLLPASRSSDRHGKLDWNDNNGTVVINRYYGYRGSLTTPPCTEGVSWFVLADPVNVTNFSVSEMHHLVSLFPGYGGYSNNTRPVQPLNGRVITNATGHH